MADRKAPSTERAVAPALDPRPTTLKDGRTVTLRRATVDDAEAVLAYVDAMRREAGAFIVLTPQQALPTIEQQRERLAGHDAEAGSLFMIAEHGEEVVATLGTRIQAPPRLAHVVGVGMSSCQAFWNSGLGTAMMSALIDWCRSHPVVLKLELNVFADNARAIALYHKFGFMEEGRLTRHTQREPGEFVDDLVMGLWLG